jgi:prepilin-type N-terminal cleavage/methylation domain-containing protein
MKQRTPKTAGGFTLLEVLLAAVLIGIAIAALVGTSGAFTMKNAAGLDLSTAEFLIEEMREMTVPMTFTALESYPDQSFNPPRDLSGAQLADFAAYTQQVSVVNVNPSDLTDEEPAGTTDFVKITVTILKNGSPVSSASWIRARLD